MKERQAGNLLPNIMVSLAAGALSCVLILMVTHGPGLGEQWRGVTDAGEDDLSQSQGGADALQGSAASGAGVEDVPEVQAALTSAAEERAQLAATLVTLNRQVIELEKRMSALSLQLAASEQAAADSTTSDTDLVPAEDSLPDTDKRSSPSERQYQGLLAVGLDEQTARDLQTRNDQYQLSRLELFDQAAREGWDNGEQLSDGLEALEQGRPDLREELGETLYDQYLYESGSANRVAIDSVIPGSSASQAGLLAGDTIISYADERAFDVQDLQQATRSGSRGESVQIVFERDGQTLTAEIIRGPMGVTLRPTREQP